MSLVKHVIDLTEDFQKLLVTVPMLTADAVYCLVNIK
jgi:hypothetical protein